MEPQDDAAKREAARLSGLLLGLLGAERPSVDQMARSAWRSRTQFFRFFQAVIEESPAAMRRRFSLERAAWQLGRTQTSVTEIAFAAGYGSLEAFTRAFRKAFRLSPSLYRRAGMKHIHLPAPNGFHFYAPASSTNSPSKGDTMDLFDIFSGAESWHTHRLLEHAGNLTDDQLDQPLQNEIKVFPWDTPDQNLRQILERLVETKEVWTAALTGGVAPPLGKRPPAERTPAALRARLESADREFNRRLEEVRSRGSWNDTFVDALCEPPETFTFGGMFAHVITFNAYRRLIALDALRRFGSPIEGFGCPSEYEIAMAASQKPA